MKKPVIDFNNLPEFEEVAIEFPDDETFRKEIDALLMNQSFDYESIGDTEE